MNFATSFRMISTRKTNNNNNIIAVENVSNKSAIFLKSMISVHEGDLEPHGSP